MLSYAPKTYQHEYYRKKSNYLRDVTHLVREKELIDICKCCFVCRMYGTHELKMVGRIMRGIRVEKKVDVIYGEKE